MPILIAIASAVLSILAGLALATTRSAGENSMMQVIANGMGWYFVARGLYMIAQALQARSSPKGTLNEWETAECNTCKGKIHPRATKCRHCGTEV